MPFFFLRVVRHFGLGKSIGWSDGRPQTFEKLRVAVRGAGTFFQRLQNSTTDPRQSFSIQILQLQAETFRQKAAAVRCSDLIFGNIY